MVVYSTGLTDYYDVDGVYIFDDAYDDLIQIDNLSWETEKTIQMNFHLVFHSNILED